MALFSSVKKYTHSVKKSPACQDRERERDLLGTISITGWSRARPGDRRWREGEREREEAWKRKEEEVPKNSQDAHLFDSPLTFDIEVGLFYFYERLCDTAG